ncbi:hypothetical protein J4421_02440 [Candidatus Woesearchaeota archaeon]|nr:hypothetical protein [Candidatus Woesearchaeota archaeon]
MDLTSTFYKEVLPGVYATTVQGIEPEKPVSVLIVGIYREPGAEQIVNFLVKQAVRIETIAYQENEHSLLEKLLEARLRQSSGVVKRLQQNVNGFHQETVSVAQLFYSSQNEGKQGIYFTLARVDPLSYAAFGLCTNPSAYYTLADSQKVPPPSRGIIATTKVMLDRGGLYIPFSLPVNGFGRKDDRKEFREFLRKYCSGPFSLRDDFADSTERVLYEKATFLLKKLDKYVRDEEKRLRRILKMLDFESTSSTIESWSPLRQMPRA